MLSLFAYALSSLFAAHISMQLFSIKHVVDHSLFCLLSIFLLPANSNMDNFSRHPLKTIKDFREPNRVK